MFTFPISFFSSSGTDIITSNCTFIAAGDANGVFTFAGTNYGISTWSNPASTGKIITTVKSSFISGDSSLYTDRSSNASVVVSELENNWITFDLTTGATLKPNYYSIRHDGVDGGYLRSWVFEGSNNVISNTVTDIDAATWTSMRTHNGDTSLNSPNKWGTWSIVNNNSYRWLRIRQTGNNSSLSLNLRLAEVEVYGLFQKI